MMLTHTWIDQYAGDNSAIGKALRDAVAGAVQFDCGPVDDIPIGKGREFCEARAPYPNTLLQFETPSSPGASHAIVLWREQPDGSVQIVVAQRGRDKAWVTVAPTTVTKNEDGGFHYERLGYDERNTEFAMLMHARAMNLFYILGCSNVETADNPALAALNKKRAKAGKCPVLEYKTLVLKIDAQRTSGQAGGGTHASPRVHLRRGHVRRLETGRRVWVQACVVGSTHGMVLKDYRVTTAGAVGSNTEAKGPRSGPA
jgi:hypothetical protein